MSNTHRVTLQEAVDLTTRYRNNHPSDSFICETYENVAIQELLAVPGCAYLRIYLGRKADDSIVTVLTAVNEKNEDILPLETAGVRAEDTQVATDGPVLLEDGYRCPESCPPKSKLNS